MRVSLRKICTSTFSKLFSIESSTWIMLFFSEKRCSLIFIADQSFLSRRVNAEFFNSVVVLLTLISNWEQDESASWHDLIIHNRLLYLRCHWQAWCHHHHLDIFLVHETMQLSRKHLSSVKSTTALIDIKFFCFSFRFSFKYFSRSLFSTDFELLRYDEACLMLIIINKVVILSLSLLNQSLLMINDIMHSLNEIALTLILEFFVIALIYSLRISIWL